MSLTKGVCENFLGLVLEVEGTRSVLRTDVLDVGWRPLRIKGKPKAFARAMIYRLSRVTLNPRFLVSVQAVSNRPQEEHNCLHLKKSSEPASFRYSQSWKSYDKIPRYR